jgi:hypothetical protein
MAARRFGAANALLPAGGLLLDGSDRAAFDRRVATNAASARRRSWQDEQQGKP